jgi:metal-responsive CopG/Arc/MetJ family transcriptional regulator
MSNKQKVTIAIDRNLAKEVDRLSREQRKSRSHLIEGAIKVWRHEQLEKELIEGYLAMSKEDRETAEGNIVAGVEVLK